MSLNETLEAIYGRIQMRFSQLPRHIQNDFFELATKHYFGAYNEILVIGRSIRHDQADSGNKLLCQRLEKGYMYLINKIENLKAGERTQRNGFSKNNFSGQVG